MVTAVSLRDDWTCTRLAQRARAPSLDQMLARKLAAPPFRSLQIGVSQESFGAPARKNMRWAGATVRFPRKRSRTVVACDSGQGYGCWIRGSAASSARVRRKEGALLSQGLTKEEREMRMTSISRRFAIWKRRRCIRCPGLPEGHPPRRRGISDMKDWPPSRGNCKRHVAYAFAPRQTRVGELYVDEKAGIGAVPMAGPYPLRATRLHA